MARDAVHRDILATARTGRSRREKLGDESTDAKFATAAAGGKVDHYNLHVILAMGYLAKSPRAFCFSPWANEVLERGEIPGVVTNDIRLRLLNSMARMLERSDNA